MTRFATSLDNQELRQYVNHQIALFGAEDVGPYLSDALERIHFGFKYCTNKYYRNESGEVFFSHKHSAQYCVFLFYLSRVAFENGDIETASSLYLLNKALNAVDAFYEIELPRIFAVEHPVGTVLGRATYSNRLLVSQNTTIGNNHGDYPEFGENVMVHFGSSIIGKTRIGNNVEISAHTYIKDEVIPSNCLVFGQSPNLVIKRRNESEMKERLYFFTY